MIIVLLWNLRIPQRYAGWISITLKDKAPYGLLEGLGFRVWGLGFRVEGLGSRA